MMKIEIEQTQNGYILREDSTSFGGEVETRVFEAYESDKQAFAALVMQMAESLGFLHDRFKNDNLRISWDALGSKYVENDEEDKEKWPFHEIIKPE